MKEKIEAMLQQYKVALDSTPYDTDKMDYASGYNNGRNVLLKTIIRNLNELLEEVTE